MNFKKRNPKKISLLFILSASFLFMLLLQQSCKKTENVFKSPVHEVDFATKFFETKTLPGTATAALIEKFKKENERTGFVAQLPENCGLPVWDKVVVINTNITPDTYNSGVLGPATTVPEGSKGESNTIIIPLTINNSNLSGVVVAERSADTFAITGYTINGYLYTLIHGTSIDNTKATNKLDFFFYLEHNTFGTNTFYHIPARLFPQTTDIDAAGDKTITIKDVNTTATDKGITCICVTYYCAVARPICVYTDCTCTNTKTVEF